MERGSAEAPQFHGNAAGLSACVSSASIGKCVHDQHKRTGKEHPKDHAEHLQPEQVSTDVLLDDMPHLRRLVLGKPIDHRYPAGLLPYAHRCSQEQPIVHLIFTGLHLVHAGIDPLFFEAPNEGYDLPDLVILQGTAP